MLDKLIVFLNRFNYPVSSHTFSLFRMLYAIYNIGIIYQLFGNWQFFFDSVAPYSYTLLPVKLMLFLWLLANLLLLTGTFTRYAAIANYTIVVLMASIFINTNISSFNDDLIRMGGFLMIILPVSRTLSVDALKDRLAFRKQHTSTNYLNYLLTILITLGLLYFASSICKILSPMWQRGLGLWIPAVIPSYKWTSFHFFVDQRWLMYGLNYFVIAFEFLFPFLLFSKKFHPYLILVGVGFHLGIAFLFPFTYISFGPIFYYSLFVPETWWIRLKAIVKSKNHLTIYYNANNANHEYAILFLSAFNTRQQYVFVASSSLFSINEVSGWAALRLACKHSFVLFPFGLLLYSTDIQNVLYYACENWLPTIQEKKPIDTKHATLKRFSFYVFIAGICGVQLLTLSYHAYTAIKTDKTKEAGYLKKRIAIQDFSTKPANLSRTLFGINSRGVFMDHAFTGSKTIFSLALLKSDGSEEWLPIFTKEGYATGDNKNFAWHKLAFNYFGRTQTQPDTMGLLKYSLLWAKRNHLSISNLNFRVYRKIYPCATHYEEGYLTKMMTMPWDTAGVITWKDSIFSYQNLVPDSMPSK